MIARRPRSPSCSCCSPAGSIDSSSVIEYLLEENRILRAAHGPRRVRLTDDQRRRLAVKGKTLGRQRLADVASIVTPDTILRWYRLLVAKGLNNRLIAPQDHGDRPRPGPMP